MPTVGDRVVAVLTETLQDWYAFDTECDPGTGGGYWTYDGSTLQPDPATTTPLDNFRVDATTDATITAASNTTLELYSNAISVDVSGSASLNLSGPAGAGIYNLQAVDTDAVYAIALNDDPEYAGGAFSQHMQIYANTAGNAKARVIVATNPTGPPDAVSAELRADTDADHTAVVSASTSDGSAAVFLDAESDTTNSSLLVDGAGSFSLTADDGTTTHEISVSSDDTAIESHNSVQDNVILMDNSHIQLQSSDIATGQTATLDLLPTGPLTLSNNNDIAILAASGSGSSTNDVTIEGTRDVVTTAAGVIAHAGHLGTDQTASATVAVGTLAAKLPIYNNSNTLVGYIPIYATIT